MSSLPPMLFPNMPAFRDANTWKTFMGVTEDNQDSYRSLADYAAAPADEAWVYSCVRQLYQAAQSVPLRVYQYQGLDLEPVIGTDNQAGKDLQHLLDWVNPVDMNGSDLKAYTMAGWAVWGGAYWKKVRGVLGGPPQELYWLGAPDVKPNAPNGRLIQYYDYNPKGGADPEKIARKDMVAFRDVNLANPIDLLSPLSSARNDISVQRQAARHTAATLKNWGIPAGAWVVPKGEEITTQDRNLIQRVLRALRGPEGAGKTPILPAGLEWQQLAMHSQDAEWIQARRISRMTVCAVLGVPLLLAGDDEKMSTYSALRDARRVMWENTVITKLDWIADVINGWLTPDFDPSGRTKVAFDYSNVSALKEAPSVEWNMFLSAMQNQAATPNEFRSRFRIGKPLPDGDRVSPKTTITLRPDLSGDPNIAASIPALNPDNKLERPPTSPELLQPGGAEGDYADLPAELQTVQQGDVYGGQLRSFGKRLYRQPAVRDFIESGGPLNTVELLGSELPEAMRTAIEDGLTRRHSAAQIADTLGEPVTPDEAVAIRKDLAALAVEVRAAQQPKVYINTSDPSVEPAYLGAFRDALVRLTNPPAVNVNVEAAPAPQVNVTMPTPIVNVEAPVVNLPAPATRSVTTKTVVRDVDDNITEIVEVTE